MDGGVSLTSRTELYAAQALGLSMEFLATSDENRQSMIMISNSMDINGVLLYPDGAPRFRCSYTNGGSATGHGNSLAETGRQRIREFYYGGGSYTGSCAGAYIASISYMSSGYHEPYYHIWPGRTLQPSIASVYTGHIISENSALLDYGNYGGDNYIASVYHNYGPYARENLDWPEGTEILMRYDHPVSALHEKVSCWAYKEDPAYGRIVVIGSHPEGVATGERLDLMKSILAYALDGTGEPHIKGDLVLGETRIMDGETEKSDPAFIRIGDKQIHHFSVQVPESSPLLRIVLEADAGFDFNLYVDPDSIAFPSSATYQSAAYGPDHEVTITNPKPGTWYVGVECATTVKAEKLSWGYIYSSGMEVLNGVAYSILATHNPVSIASEELPSDHQLINVYPNPFNASTRIEYLVDEPGPVQISIHDLRGREITTLVNETQNSGSHQIVWNGRGESGRSMDTGIYVCHLKTGDVSVSTKLILMK